MMMISIVILALVVCINGSFNNETIFVYSNRSRLLSAYDMMENPFTADKELVEKMVDINAKFDTLVSSKTMEQAFKDWKDNGYKPWMSGPKAQLGGKALEFGLDLGVNFACGGGAAAGKIIFETQLGTVWGEAQGAIAKKTPFPVVFKHPLLAEFAKMVAKEAAAGAIGGSIGGAAGGAIAGVVFPPAIPATMLAGAITGATVGVIWGTTKGIAKGVYMVGRSVHKKKKLRKKFKEVTEWYSMGSEHGRPEYDILSYDKLPLDSQKKLLFLMDMAKVVTTSGVAPVWVPDEAKVGLEVTMSANILNPAYHKLIESGTTYKVLPLLLDLLPDLKEVSINPLWVPLSGKMLKKFDRSSLKLEAGKSKAEVYIAVDGGVKATEDVVFAPPKRGSPKLTKIASKRRGGIDKSGAKKPKKYKIKVSTPEDVQQEIKSDQVMAPPKRGDAALTKITAKRRMDSFPLLPDGYTRGYVVSDKFRDDSPYYGNGYGNGDALVYVLLTGLAMVILFICCCFAGVIGYTAWAMFGSVAKVKKTEEVRYEEVNQI